MGWSYRKRIKILPGIHLNLSKRGISTSIGVKGASLTLGQAGTFINTSIPGTGFSYRRKLHGAKNTPQLITRAISFDDNIFSADVHEITSQNMAGVKEAIVLATRQRQELSSDLLEIKKTLSFFKFKLIASYILLYGLIKRNISNDLKVDIALQKEAISQVQLQIENSNVQLEVDFDLEIKRSYANLVASFKQLATSHKIWDVTSAHFQDRVVMRSAASTIVRKREVRFATKSLPEIKSNLEVLYLKNANGADLYIYPSFIIMYSSRESFALIGIDELDFNYGYVRFTETGNIPLDSKIIDYTWYKVNKNGTPDRRFKGNYRIPIAKYGEIRLRTSTGVNEEYEFSNYEFTQQFGNAFEEYQNLIKSLNQINDVN